MSLPFELYSALEHEIGAGEKALAPVVQELSARYRGQSPVPAGRFATTGTDVAAYAAYRMPATYAAVRAVFVEVAERLGSFEPLSVLDIGAGPGTVMWAATDVWPSIARVTLVEREPEMIRLGRRLACWAPQAAVREAHWVETDVTREWETAAADLVVASYVLGELAPGSLQPLVDRLWRLAAAVLVLIEPGTPAGFGRIAQARAQLIQLGADVAAPCPHRQACPLQEGDWCHFAQRVQRTRFHRQLKQAELPYEDEKYAYIAVAKAPVFPAAARVLRRPKARKGHVELELCTPAGVERAVVSRKEGDRYRWARKAEWGSGLPAHLSRDRAAHAAKRREGEGNPQ